jgi:hypothetical protein
MAEGKAEADLGVVIVARIALGVEEDILGRCEARSMCLFNGMVRLKPAA